MIFFQHHQKAIFQGWRFWLKRVKEFPFLTVGDVRSFMAFRCGNRSCARAWRRAGGAGHLGEGIASYRRGSNWKDSQIFSIHFGPLAKEVGISELTPVAQKRGWVERLVSEPLHFGGFWWISSTPCLGHTVLVVCIYICNYIYIDIQSYTYCIHAYINIDLCLCIKATCI